MLAEILPSDIRRPHFIDISRSASHCSSESEYSDEYIFHGILRSFPRDMHLFRCHKHKIPSVWGNKVDFTFYHDSLPVLHAKTKSSSTQDSIGLSTQMGFDNFEGFLLHNRKYNDFSLRIGSPYGEESLAIHLERSGSNRPRSMTIYFFKKSFPKPEIAKSSLPVLNSIGMWEADLNSKCAIRSSKNFRLVDDDNNPVIFIRKVSKNTIEIEALQSINQLRLFSVCIGAFLCKL